MIHLWRQTPFRNALMLRGLVAWFVLRVAAGASGAGPWGAGALNPLAQAGLLCVVAGLVIVDARRRNEVAFLANLGVPRWAIGVTGVVATLPFELLALVAGIRAL